MQNLNVFIYANEKLNILYIKEQMILYILNQWIVFAKSVYMLRP